MPLLGTLLSGLFVGIAEFFAKWITRKVAAAAAGIAIFMTITGALYLALAALVTGLVYAFPPSASLATGIWLAVPDNTPAVLAAVLSCDAAVAIYRMNVMNVQFSVYAP